MSEGSTTMTQPPNDPPESLVAYQLRIMNDSISNISSKIDDLPEKYVTRREWESRNETVNDHIARRGRETGKLEERVNGIISTVDAKLSQVSGNARSNVALVLSGIGIVASIIIAAIRI